MESEYLTFSRLIFAIQANGSVGCYFDTWLNSMQALVTSSVSNV